MKNIVLIGGSHGIGKAIVDALQENNNIYVASRTSGDLSHPNVTHLPFDVHSDMLDLAALPEAIDGFVYCPGSINLKPFKMLGEQAFRDDMEVNFFQLVKVVQQLLPRMAADSAMVFFSTVAVGTGMPYHTSVAAAKGAVEGFAKSLAAEYAPKIRINVIAPSLTDTNLASRLLNNDKKRELMAQRHPLKKIGNAEDVGNIAAFLLSDKSTWITGQILGVDGGKSTLNVN